VDPLLAFWSMMSQAKSRLNDRQAHLIHNAKNQLHQLNYTNSMETQLYQFNAPTPSQRQAHSHFKKRGAPPSLEVHEARSRHGGNLDAQSSFSLVRAIARVLQHAAPIPTVMRRSADYCDIVVR
jgi:hypothetical protein